MIESAWRRVRSYYAVHPWALDVTLLVAITAAAGALRLSLLGEIPYGVHSDEAQLGTDARKILDGELWTVYTKAVLGQPSGHAYLTLPSLELLGYNAFAMRLPLALVALAAVPLLYLLVRLSCGRVEAMFAAGLLATSYWHLFYSRVAHWSISYGTIILASLLCFMLGMRDRHRRWFVASGVLLGLGMYTYNIYPVAVVAVGVFVAIVSWREHRRDAWPEWRRSMLWMWGAALVVAAPMLIYIANPNSVYWSHIDNYSEVGVARSEEFDDAGAFEKARLIGEQAWAFAKAYTWEGRLDDVDGYGVVGSDVDPEARAVFDPPTLLLLVAGLGFAFARRREPMVIAALCCLLIIPLPAVLQRGSIMRQPVGAAPFAMFLAALPLAWLWRTALESPRRARYVVMVATMSIVVLIATITVRDYFWVWRDDAWPRLIYFSEMTTASDYMRELPDGSFVLFYSERASIDLESRQFLAPDVEGSDRSVEYGPFGESIEVYDRDRMTVFILLDRYVDLLPQIEERYPGGTVRVFERDGKFEFASYELPPRPPAIAGP